MSQTNLNVLFKKIQKDDKKEVLEFHVQGDELPHSSELIELAGNIVVLEIVNSGESVAGKFNAEFKAVQRDSKKTTLKFNAKGDSEDKMVKLYPHAGRTVSLTLEPSQMSIEDFNSEQHEGVKYKVEKDGTASVSPDQLTIDNVPSESDDDPFSDEDLLN